MEGDKERPHGASGELDAAPAAAAAVRAAAKPAATAPLPHPCRPASPWLGPPPASAQRPASSPLAAPAPAPALPDLAPPLAACQAALPGSRGEAYLRHRGMPLALAQQLGVGYAAPGTWPHAARDWRGGRVVCPHTPPDGRLVNLYGRAVGTADQVPKAKRHDHLSGAKGYFHTAALQAGAGPLWVCEGVFDALALIAAGVPRVVAIFGVQGWCWDWVREVRGLVFALDADAAGQQQWHALARQAALRGKQVGVLPPEAYGEHKDASAAWAAGVLAVGAGLVVPEYLREVWEERAAIMAAAGGLPRLEAERCAWTTLQAQPAGRTEMQYDGIPDPWETPTGRGMRHGDHPADLSRRGHC